MNNLKSHWRWGVAGLAVAAFCVVCFLFLDRPAADWFHALPEAWHRAGTLFSRWGIAEYWVLAPALVCAIFYGVRKNRADCFRCLFPVLAVVVSGLGNSALKFGFGRCRPKLWFEAQEYGFNWFHGTKAVWQSFPSGHTVAVAAAATALWLAYPRLRPLALLYVGMMMAARLLAGAHYPGDVVASAFVGAAVTAVIWKQMRKYGLCGTDNTPVVPPA